MPTELISRYDTIGHRILDLEAELGVFTESHKETLDRLIEEARKAIHVKGTYTREDAVGILRTINSVLQNNGFEQIDREKHIDGLNLFYEGLSSKKIDCDNTSFIYLSIADALKLPIAAVSAPEHLFVRFILNGEEINWETTSAEEIGNDYYRSLLNISDKAISKGVYLRNLTRQGAMAVVYNKRGIAWAGKGNLDSAIEDYDAAIRIDPNLAIAYNNRGNAWVGKGNLDSAIEDYDAAIRIDPNHVAAYNNRGNAWAGKGNLDSAIEDYDAAIRIDPNLAIAYNDRGNAWAGKGNLDKAIADYDKAIELDPNYAEAYNNRGVSKLRKLNLIGAGADFMR